MLVWLNASRKEATVSLDSQSLQQFHRTYPLNSTDNPGELTPEEQKYIFGMRIEFLERELSEQTSALESQSNHYHCCAPVLKKEEAVEAIHAKNELRERVKVQAGCWEIIYT